MKRVNTAMFALAVLAELVACAGETAPMLPPVGQLLLYVDTDAPLPPPPGTVLAANDPPALFDRVRIEVFRPGETSPCGDCVHEFDLDRDLVGGGRASVGITTPPRISGYVARVRLFKAAFVELGQPRPDVTIDASVTLPTTDDEGIKPVTVFMRTDDVGKKLAREPELGVTPGGRVGTWPGARRVPCSGQPMPGEVCIPGGAFWMGNPQARVYHVQGDEVVMRLVVLSPFFLDTTEAIVSSFRAAGVAKYDDPMLYSFNDPDPNTRVRCTYTTAVASYESLPVNCVSYDTARAYCNARGADLPTEAQYQYAAGGLAGNLYPWGDDAPVCGDAVYARVRGALPPLDWCPGAWVLPPGNGARDRLVLEGGTVVDLAGNLSEYARDRWNLQTEACWRPGILRDPLCDTPSADTATRSSHTVVGGSFVDQAARLAAPFRQPTIAFDKAQASGTAGGAYILSVTNTGFRCSRRATAP
jgi:formylglycine-generating enzyme required for sulfatase activity